MIKFKLQGKDIIQSSTLWLIGMALILGVLRISRYLFFFSTPRSTKKCWCDIKIHEGDLGGGNPPSFRTWGSFAAMVSSYCGILWFRKPSPNQFLAFFEMQAHSPAGANLLKFGMTRMFEFLGVIFRFHVCCFSPNSVVTLGAPGWLDRGGGRGSVQNSSLFSWFRACMFVSSVNFRSFRGGRADARGFCL